MTTLTFVLPRAARVIFTVTQVSPRCALIGRFGVHGKAGVNRIRFAGRLGKERLTPGTYQITAQTRTGHVVQPVLLVVAHAAPTRSELAAARAANTCGPTDGAAFAGGLTAGASNGTSALLAPNGLRRGLTPDTQKGDAAAQPGAVGGVLASAVDEAARAIQPALIILLASIVLLAVASLPGTAVPDPRLNEVLVRHRPEIALFGATALVAFMVTLFVF